MKRQADSRLTTAETLLAAAVDRLSMLVWMQSKDGQRGKNRPRSILSEINSADEKPVAFRTAADFELARQKLLKG